MRRIGRVRSEEHAKRFGDYLYAQGIDNEIEPADDGQWVVWAHDERQLDPAKQLLERFNEAPDRPEFAQATEQANQRRKAEQKAEKQRRKRQVDVRSGWHAYDIRRLSPLVGILILLSVGVTILSRFGDDPRILNVLMITQVRQEGGWIYWQPGLPEVLEGEIWRLLTPIFLHFNILHILFNMLWLKDLGTLIERQHGWWYLLAMVVLIGVAGNLGQYAASGPLFGGFSGVVYGLLGYVWLRGKFDPGSGLYLNRPTVILMLGWFALCWTGWMGPIGNIAHTVGLVLGAAWGYLTSGHLWRRFR